MTPEDDEDVQASRRRLAEDGVAKAREAYERFAHAGEHVLNAFEASTSQTLAAMRAFAGSTRDSMQQMTESSATGARSASEHLVGAGERGYNALEESAARTWAGMREIAQRVLIASDTNVRATLDCAEKLARATDAKEFVTLQAAFLQEQSQRLTQQLVDLQQTTARVARDVAPARVDKP
jgi:hypothetical protein